MASKKRQIKFPKGFTYRVWHLNHRKQSFIAALFFISLMVKTWSFRLKQGMLKLDDKICDDGDSETVVHMPGEFTELHHWRCRSTSGRCAHGLGWK